MDTKQQDTDVGQADGTTERREWMTPDFRAIALGTARAVSNNSIDPGSS